MVNRKYANDRIKALSDKIVEVHHRQIVINGRPRSSVMVYSKEALSADEIKAIEKYTHRIHIETLDTAGVKIAYFEYAEDQ